MSLATKALEKTERLPPALPPGPVWRFTVDQYHAMIKAGILTEEDRVELLEGWLIPKMTKNPRHCTATWLARTALERVTPAGWYVDSQDPVTTSESEPEPDTAVIRGNRRDYTDRHPGPADTAMLVEVSDSSLGRDRGLKKRVYARAAVPVYWIVNLPENRIEVYSDPTGPADEPDYRQRRDYLAGEEVPVVIDGREVGQVLVRDLLP